MQSSLRSGAVPRRLARRFTPTGMRTLTRTPLHAGWDTALRRLARRHRAPWEHHADSHVAPRHFTPTCTPLHAHLHAAPRPLAADSRRFTPTCTPPPRCRTSRRLKRRSTPTRTPLTPIRMPTHSDSHVVPRRLALPPRAAERHAESNAAPTPPPCAAERHADSHAAPARRGASPRLAARATPTQAAPRVHSTSRAVQRGPSFSSTSTPRTLSTPT
jgi:hypothetical protein